MDSTPATPLPDLSGLHPYCRALFARWEEARGGAFAPSWRTLDLIRIAPAAALTLCVMVERAGKEPEFVHRFFGTWHVSIHDRDYTGQSIAAIRPASHPARLKAEYLEVIAQRRPLAFHFDVPVQTGTRAHREAIRLPLSEDGAEIGAIVSATVFLEGEKEALAYFRAHQRAGA